MIDSTSLTHHSRERERERDGEGEEGGSMRDGRERFHRIMVSSSAAGARLHS